MLKERGFQEINDEFSARVIVLRNRTKVNRDWITKHDNVAAIIKPGTGTDNVDLEALKEKKIGFYNSPGANANGVAELALMLALMSLRDAFRLELGVKSKNSFAREGAFGKELRGRNVGIIGTGSIGRQLVEYLHPFKCHIRMYDLYPNLSWLTDARNRGIDCEYTTMEELCSKSKVISLHLPLTSDTDGMIDDSVMSTFSKHTILINTSRAQLVNLKDLKAHMDCNPEHIAFYAADCINDENALSDLEKELLQRPNFILTPHIGAQTKRSYTKMCTDAVEKFLDTIKGEN